MSEAAWTSSTASGHAEGAGLAAAHVGGQQRQRAAHPLRRREQRVAHGAVHGRRAARPRRARRRARRRRAPGSGRGSGGYVELDTRLRTAGGRQIIARKSAGTGTAGTSRRRAAAGRPLRASAMTRAGSIRSSGGGPGPSRPSGSPRCRAARCGFRARAHIAQKRHPVLHLAVGVDDAGRRRAGCQAAGGRRRAEHGAHVAQALALDAPLDRLDHLRLDVLGVDAARWGPRGAPAGS